jgi:pimeloyl-ACP methyl ester carboxylesterase
MKRHVQHSPLSLLLTLALHTAGCGDDDNGPSGLVDEGEPPVAGCTGGELTSGALTRVCFPASWNGDLVVYAHGYIRPDEPLALPDDVVNGFSVSTAVNALGYAFATTSYRANGLVADVAVEDLLELEADIDDRYRPDPGRTFIVGASEGGLVATLALEQEPDTYAGALAACGPIGDFVFQIDYFGDFRAVFDYYFPDVLPGSVAEFSAEARDNWDAVYVPAIIDALTSDPQATAELLLVMNAPIDPLDINTVGQTVIGALAYSVFGTADAQARLGGQPYDNTTRIYQGSEDDAALNAGIERYTADPAARAALDERFQTTGQLTRPLVTLHTTGDPIVPVAHQGIYADKVAAAGAGSLLQTIDAYDRYGHCTFQQAELIGAFNSLVTVGTP